MIETSSFNMLGLLEATPSIFRFSTAMTDEKDKLDLIVFILRGQPLHNAHVEIMRKAAEKAKKVLIIIGSANEPSTFKNPFTTSERANLINAVLNSSEEDFVPKDFVIEHVENNTYNDNAWAKRIQSLVSLHSDPKSLVGIIGHEKDTSSFYLKMFPQWERIEVDLVEQLSATDIRNLYFKENHNLNFIKSVVPSVVFDFLKNYANTESFTSIIEERLFVEKYKKAYSSLPYSPIFVTTDAVVVCAGHILMIKRKAFPGKGLWALPGGFVNADTDVSILDAAIRELKEETNIKVPKSVLLGSVKSTKYFDAISRSTRGRTITHAFYIELKDTELPKIKGGDDAESSMWIPIGELKKNTCYEDHYEIQQYFVGA